MGSHGCVLPGADSLTPFWTPVDTRTVLRAAWLGGVWVVVAVVVGAVLVSAVALVGAAVTAIVGLFGESISIADTTRRTAFVGGGIAASGAVVASTWAAAYASTQDGSRWRMLAGSAVGVAFGLGLVGIGSLGAPAAALAGGWGTAIPSDRFVRTALRSVPLALVALLPILQAQEGWLQWLIAGVGGIVAAWVWVAVAEGFWAVVSRIPSRYAAEPATMHNKTDHEDRVSEGRESVDERKRDSKPRIPPDDENAEEEPWRTSI